MKKITDLLHPIDIIRTRYREIAKETGENYNVFEILNIETKELIHTHFIADMLNPKGTHGLDDVPLKLFLQEIEKKDLFSKDIKAFAEKDYGSINKTKTSGGRIDISLEIQNGKSILIENKIYAKDQEDQLLRYHNIFKDVGGSFILYLTLDGKKPTDQSIGKSTAEGVQTLSKDDYLCISYKDNILPWLEKCCEKAVNLPRLRETLKQYITLVNSLTGNSNNKKMSKEIGKQLAQSKESIQNAFLVVSSIDNMKEELIQKLLTDVQIDFVEVKDFKSVNEWEKNKYWDITLPVQNHDFDIVLSFEENRLSLGVPNGDKSFDKKKNDLFNKLNGYKICPDGKTSKPPNENWYPTYIWFTYDIEVQFNPGIEATWLSILNKDLSQQIIDELKSITNFIDQGFKNV